jgi:prophage regulatory protein
MTVNEISAPRTNVATSVDFKSQQNQIKARAADLHSSPAQWGSGIFNVAPPTFKNCCGLPNNPNRFGALSETGYICQSQLILTILPFSSATLWRKVESGPVKLGPQITAWGVQDIRSLVGR